MLGGKTVLSNDDANTVSKMFGYLKEHWTSSEQIYDDILEQVFNSKNRGSITLCNISSSEGEVGLRVTASERYFALVYIGDVSSFKKGLGGHHGLIFQEDKFSNSLFDAINDNDSPINILIGAKKFVEGWDSFRVSTMGLLNTGRNKGSQIIQLFGRGVRIRGYGNSMKRSKAMVDERTLEVSPPNLSYLETLSIFGIRADYVDVFKTQLEEEGIYEEEVMSLRISKTADIPKKSLRTIKLTNNTEFSRCVILENFDTGDVIEIDYRPKIQIYESGQESIEAALNKTSEFLLHEYLDLLDWDRIYFELYDFKQFRKFYNLHFDKKTIKEIMDGAKYKIHVDAEFDIVHTGSEFLERLVLQILKKHTVSFYNAHKRRWLSDNLKYVNLSDDDSNFGDYKIMIDKKEISLISDIKRLISDVNKVYMEDTDKLPSIVFDKHLYQPIIVKNSKIRTIPVGLNDGERRFIEDLRTYFLNHRNDATIRDYMFYILRNQSKSGVGFLADTDNFYPDFIMWAKNKRKEKIIFIDPKGLIHGPAENSAKIRVHDTINEIQKKLNNDGIEMSSFIVSNSPFSKIKRLDNMKTKREFEERHVVFQDDDDYVEKIISFITAKS